MCYQSPADDSGQSWEFSVMYRQEISSLSKICDVLILEIDLFKILLKMIYFCLINIHSICIFFI